MVELLAKKDKKVKKPWPWPDNYTLKLEEFITGIINKESAVAYAGGESFTLNGFIIKMGITGSIGGFSSTTVTFAIAFPNSLLAAVPAQTVSNASEPMIITASSTSAITIKNATGGAGVAHWIAVGH